MIKTSYGYLRGTCMQSRSGRVFSAFLGIPYALPPVGNLRFLPPVSPNKWEGIRDATQEGNICSQGKYGGCEDCLYVNVFSHLVQKDSLSPVMFYIHGGSFYMGSPALGLTGPEYLMDRDIVLVTVRYRLGPFGFLSTEDSVIPGNMGLKDQVKALKWVQENIAYFGGDPRNVTLFGCSAGGSSVHLHMQSQASQNLFKRGISQSGTALSAFALMGKGSARKYSQQLAKLLNCFSDNSETLLKCLQEKTTAEIENAHQTIQNSRNAMIKSIFRPVIEETSYHAFLTSNPLLATTHKPWLTGITANEGVLDIRVKYLDYTIDQVKSYFCDFGPKALLFEDICSEPRNVSEQIHKFYFNCSSTSHEILVSIEKMFTDWWFLWPVEQAINHHKGILYYYLYDHRGEHSYTEVYDSPKGLGVSHLDDLISLFNHSQLFPTLNRQDTNISNLMVDFWVNFATYGDPTPHPVCSNPQEQENSNLKWLSSSSSDPSYLHIQTNTLSMEKRLYPERLQFWRNLHVIDKFQ